MFFRVLSKAANSLSSGIRAGMSKLLDGLKFAKEKLGEFLYNCKSFIYEAFDVFIWRPFLSPLYYWIITNFGSKEQVIRCGGLDLVSGFADLSHSAYYVNAQELAADIKANPGVTTIWLENLRGLQELDLEGIPYLPYLKTLRICSIKMNGKAIEAIIKKAPNLQLITLVDVDGLDACDLTGLQPLNSLTTISIYANVCQSHVIEQLIKCAPNLVNGRVWDGDLSTMNLEGLSDRPKLESFVGYSGNINPIAAAILMDKAPNLDPYSILYLTRVSGQQVIAKFPKVLHNVSPLFNAIFVYDIIAQLMTVKNRVLMFTLLQTLSNDKRKEVLQNGPLVQRMIDNNLCGIEIDPKPITDTQRFSILHLFGLNSKRAGSPSQNNSSKFVNDLRPRLFRYVGAEKMSSILLDHHARKVAARRNKLNAG